MKLSARQVTFFTLSRWICYSLLGILLTQSCTVPRKYQAYKPFVYKTNIEVTGKLPGADRTALEERLQNQLDDSLKTRVKSYAGIRREIIRPPVFDTLNIGRSKVFMRSLLNSLGYFEPVIEDTFYIDTVRDQYRTRIDFTVQPGKVLRIDSIGFVFNTPELQQLSNRHRNNSLLKKNEPYSIQLVASEMDRLLDIFRNNGYYKFSREDFYAEVDTVVAALIDPTLDPFEQIQLLDSLQKKRENPTINVVFKQRPADDSSHLQKYYMGNIRVYPDLIFLEDSTAAKDSARINDITFLYSSRRFKLPFIARNISLRPGSLYRQENYYKTINTFNQLGAWKNVDLALQERIDSVPLLDATLRLYPEKKQSLTIDLETSRNVSDYLTTGQLFGIGFNVRLLNRNAYREAIQTSTNARFGIELGSNFVQTLQASLAHTVNIPRLVKPNFLNPWKKREQELIAPRTIVNLNTAYTDRRDFFKVTSFNGSWGYEWTVRQKKGRELKWPRTWQWIIPNFEYTNVQKTDSLRKLEGIYPSLSFAFNDGLIISQIFSFSTGREKENKLTLIRSRIEESGAIAGLIRRLEVGDLRRFIKIDGEFKHFINYKRSSWAFRAYAGYGHVYGKADTTGNGNIVSEHNLPFFKAFFAGGPYSMRAWQIRRLGPGSATLYDPPDTSAIERFGNMQLELNAEYRFDLTTIAGIKVRSAFFVDIGNIWSKEFDSNKELIPEASFKPARLYKDLAVGGGTSIRLDFDFLLIRLDWAYKLKNPRFAHINDGWFHALNIDSGQLQLGIGYPF